MAIKFCTKCGRKFEAAGREVICPSCKEEAAQAAKSAAVERAKRASWTGESVPVRISGRASTIIRCYGKEKSLPFAAALDALLQSTQFFVNLDTDWSTIVPYKSRRMKSSTDTPQDTASKPQDAQEVKAAKSKPSKVAKKAVKTVSKK